MTITIIVDNHGTEISIAYLQRILSKSFFVAALTGAGISVASGIPLITDTVEDLDLRQFFQRETYESNREKFFHVYRTVLRKWRFATPNVAHQCLSRQGTWVITQNVDGLHRDIGTEHLIELHGNLRELCCESCKGIFSSQIVWRQVVPRCPTCQEYLRPGFTFEGEEVRHYSRAVDWVGRSEVLLVIGTALKMNPVCNLPKIAESNGAIVAYINAKADLIVGELWKSAGSNST